MGTASAVLPGAGATSRPVSLAFRLSPGPQPCPGPASDRLREISRNRPGRRGIPDAGTITGRAAARTTEPGRRHGPVWDPLAGQRTRMNPVERVIRRVDAAQQRHRVSALIFGVIKKYGDDNGGVLASNMAHSAFLSVFPLLLILVTVLSRRGQFPGPAGRGTRRGEQPVPGDRRHTRRPDHRPAPATTAGLVIGVLLLVWGASGLAQAGLFAMAQVWNLPGPARPGYLPGSPVARCSSACSRWAWRQHGARQPGHLRPSLGRCGDPRPGARRGRQRRPVPGQLPGAHAQGDPGQDLVPGAAAGGAAWTVLLALGAYVVHHDLRTPRSTGFSPPCWCCSPGSTWRSR